MTNCRCGRPAAKSDGLCNAHHIRVRLHGTADWDRPVKNRRGGTCLVERCKREAIRLKMCGAHYVWSYEHEGAAPPPVPNDPCPICGAPVDRSISAKRRFCSKQCGYSNVSGRPNWRIAAERDGLACHLCGEDVDTAARPRTHRYPSLDHIIPRSLGGSDELDNLKLAHTQCNQRRQNRPLDLEGLAR